jgi:hypothetical protein
MRSPLRIFTLYRQFGFVHTHALNWIDAPWLPKSESGTRSPAPHLRHRGNVNSTPNAPSLAPRCSGYPQRLQHFIAEDHGQPSGASTTTSATLGNTHVCRCTISHARVERLRDALTVAQPCAQVSGHVSRPRRSPPLTRHIRRGIPLVCLMRLRSAFGRLSPVITSKRMSPSERCRVLCCISHTAGLYCPKQAGDHDTPAALHARRMPARIC